MNEAVFCDQFQINNQNIMKGKGNTGKAVPEFLEEKCISLSTFK